MSCKIYNIKYCLLLIAICFVTFVNGQESGQETRDRVLNDYLAAIGADKLDSINSILLKYEAKTAIGDVIEESKYYKDRMVQSVYLAGNLIVTVVVSDNECYSISNGIKQALPNIMCSDHNFSVALFPEINLLNYDNLKVEKIELNGENLYSVSTVGEETSYSFIYDKSTGLKVMEKSFQDRNNEKFVTSYFYSDYKLFGNIQFAETKATDNLLSTGMAAEYKLVDVQYNVESDENK